VTEENNNPCQAPALPHASGSGELPVPELEGFQFDPPKFPNLEPTFPGNPVARRCIMVPRYLSYGVHSRSTIITGNGTDESPDRADNPRLTNSNPDRNPQSYDALRFLLKKVYDFEYTGNKNFVANPSPEENQRVNTYTWLSDSPPVDIVLSKLGTQLPPPGFPQQQHPTLMVSVLMPGNAVRSRWNVELFENDFVRQKPEIFDFYLQMINLKFGHNGEVRETSPWYVDTSFSAPAAFFAKEADGLNLRLPETVSMQTFIPNMLTYDDTGADYNNLYNEGTRDPILKKSLYERYSIEFDGRPDYCNFSGDVFQGDMDSGNSAVTVHKFPADKISKLNSITAMATPPPGQTEFSSFQRIFESEYKYYTKISFDINHESPIAAKLKEKNLDHLLMGVIDIESPSKDQIFTQFLDERVQNFTGVSDNDGTHLNTRPNCYPRDIRHQLMKYLNPDHPHSHTDRMEFVLDPATYPLSFKHEDGWLAEFESLFGQWNPMLYTMQHWGCTSQFHSWLSEYMLDKHPQFIGKMKEDLSYSEVLAYRLEKRDASSGEVIQNFYFFNDPETEKINFIDTQVSFGSKYTYSIYVINFVRGLKYRYRPRKDPIRRNISRSSHLNPETGSGLMFEFLIDQMVHDHIIETPYHQQDLLVADAPPLPPDVTFLPWETLSEDLALFWFTPRIGEYREQPIAILEGDQEVIERMKLAQNASYGGFALANSEILYRSDSDPTHYEMFVLDSPPLSYHDFLHARHTETTISSPTMLKRVQPNQDYYITFRARDLGGISQPTKVFRFRISSFGDGIEHEIEEYIFPQPSMDYLMEFNQMLEIMPNSEQTAINFENSETYPNQSEDISEFMKTTRGTTGLSLGSGPQEDSVWDKTYIFEIISSQTGKKVKIEATWSQIVDGNLPGSEELMSGFTLRTGCYEPERKFIYRSNREDADSAIGESISRAIDETSDSLPSRRGSRYSRDSENYE